MINAIFLDIFRYVRYNNKTMIIDLSFIESFKVIILRKKYFFKNTEINMKKIIKASAFAAIFILLILSLSACAKVDNDASSGLVLSFDKDSETYTIVGYNGGATLTIPEKYNDSRITAIGNGAFTGNTVLTDITIPSSIESIGSTAFDGCSELKKVTFKDYAADSALTTLGTGCFSGCAKLETIALPSSIKSIGYKAFSDCVLLASVRLPESLESIYNFAFNGCSSLSEVEICAEGSFLVYSNAFSGCTALTTLATPETYDDEAMKKQVYVYDPATKLMTGNDGKKLVKYLDPAGESSCTISAAIEEIEAGAFMSQDKLVKINVDPDNKVFTATEDGILLQGTVVVAYPVGKTETELKLPESITDIGAFAFAGNKNLTSLVLPAAVKSIGISAFKNCSNLSSVVFADGAVTVDVDAFRGCDKLASYRIEDASAKYKVSDRLLYSDDGKTLVSYPAELESESVTLPSDVSDIVQGAFAYSSKLKRFAVADGNSALATDESGVLYKLDASGKKIAICAYPVAAEAETYTAPDSVKTLYAYAFAYNKSLKSVTLSSGVTKLEKGLFCDCNALEVVTALSKELAIEADAFAGCTALKTFNFVGNEAAWEQTVSKAKLGSGNTVLTEAGKVTVNCNYSK